MGRTGGLIMYSLKQDYCRTVNSSDADAVMLLQRKREGENIRTGYDGEKRRP